MANNLPIRMYCSKKTGKMYPFDEDKVCIDLDNEIPEVPKDAYKLTGENNNFYVYDLNRKYMKKLKP